jgi:hypothetical protein
MTTRPDSRTGLDELAQARTQLTEAADRVIADGLAGGVADEDIAETLYAAARLFAARTDKNGKTAWPVTKDALTATETVVLVTALLDAADVNIFDMAIWYRRAE